MTEEVEVATEEVVDQVEQETPESAPSPEQIEAEAEARKYGWRPKEEFDRDPEGWVDAGRFLELPSTHLKMQRDTTRELQKQLKARDDELSGIKRAAKEAVEAVRRQEREKFESEIASIREQQRRAVEEGDVDRFDTLTKREEDIRKRAPAAPAPEVEAPAYAAEVQDYMAKNPWTQNQEALAFARGAIEMNPEVKLLPARKQVEWAEKKVKDNFPELFEAPKAAAPSRVDGGGLGISRKSGKGADDLPPDARAVGQEFVKDGIFKSIDDYAKAFFVQGN